MRAAVALQLALAALVAVSAASGVQHEIDVEAYEYAEWAPFLSAMRGEVPDLMEPDTTWLKVCSGWTALEMCSTVFGSELPEELVYEEDLGYLPRAVVDYTVDYVNRLVDVQCTRENPDNQTYRAIFRDGIGCTLVESVTEEEIRAQDLGDMTPPEPLDENVPWPVGEGFFPGDAPAGINLTCVAAVSADQFSQPIPNPRAIVVIYKGALVFEEYGTGISKTTRLIGWSASKSLTQALIGVVVGDGLLDIYEPAPVPEWYEQEGDARQNITVDMMLRMSSGTQWIGDIGPTTECVFWSNNNCAGACAAKPLVADPDTLWNYNSGSTYILSRMALQERADPEWTNWEWPKRRLFYPIGAYSMYIEYQANGFFLGGGYGYGTARDWARFGLLFLRDGVWVDGTRILPEGWVKYSSTASHTNDGYAAHFWKYPSIDPDLFYASGFRNQNVFVFPNQDLVIARFAMPPLAGHPVWNTGEFLTSMLACLE